MDNFTREDFYSLEKLSPLFTKKKINQVIDETVESVSKWPELAKEWDVPKTLVEEIKGNLRLHL